jgi:hypothetical protein
MIIDLSDEDRQFLGFHLACRLEDYEKITKKDGNKPEMVEQAKRLEKIIYTKIIPESYKDEVL